jgi:hypothetical protein
MKNFQQTPRQQRKSIEKRKTAMANSRKPTSLKAPLADRLRFYQPEPQHWMYGFGFYF